MIKTYIINGFLESGKTTFIKRLLEQDYFLTGERTLLFLCEEGEEEFDVANLMSKNVYLAEIDDEQDFNPEYITQIEKDIKPKRIIVEYNGMWKITDKQLPWYWDNPIEITLFNASTFDMFSKNMKTFVAEQVKTASMIIFNRCDSYTDMLIAFRRNIKAINSTANIVFEDKNGELDISYEDDLPYDISANSLHISQDKFGIFYLDAMENVERYLGKKLSLEGKVINRHKDNSNTMVIGRMVMTCCAEDLTLFGFICDFENNTKLQIGDWVNITATVGKDYAEKYDMWYPILQVNSYAKCDPPDNEVLENI